MIEQVEYLASWVSVKLSKRLGQRGAEMVEYAIVLACVVVLAAWYYGDRDKGAGYDNGAAGKLTLKHIVTQLWNQIAGNAKSGAGY